MFMYEVADLVDDLIEIVKEVAEEYKHEVCEWKEDGVNYHTCEGEKYICGAIDEFVYCPYCGKKVKEVK